MNDEREDIEDADVPVQAVEGLSSAQYAAMQSGRTIVFIRDNQLIEKSAEGERVLKTLPPQKQVPIGTFRINS